MPPSESDSRVSTDVAPLRVPPHSVEAEQAVLGGLMRNNEAIDDVVDRLGAEDFYRREHQLVFRAISALAKKSQPADSITISSWLQQQKQLEEIGGVHYLALLLHETTAEASALILAYADTVRECSVRRQLVAVSHQIADLIYKPGERNNQELLDQAEQMIFQIADQNRLHKGPVDIGTLVGKTVQRIHDIAESESDITGVPTGFQSLDSITAGLQYGDFCIIAGRPSMGKTSFAMNIASHVAISQRLPVLVFSMEMSGEQIALRLLSALSKIELNRLRCGNLRDSDWTNITSSMHILEDCQILIDDTSGMSPEELRARARRVKREHGLSMILVDYLQLMRSARHQDNRVMEISDISRQLKALARELEVPVVALSQLNRGLEMRQEKRPVLSDLRDSGAIEQDADLILFIYRDEVYNENSNEKGIAEILVRKQRNGPTGSLRLTFRGEYTRFENYRPEIEII